MTKKRGTGRTYRCPPDHRHGQTGTCYGTHKCGCDSCVTGNTERVGRSRKLRAYGRMTDFRVDCAASATHVRALRAKGWTVPGIANASGVSEAAIYHTLSTKYRRVSMDTEAGILSVPLVDPPGMTWGRVPTLGARRRIQALMFMGWPQVRLEEIGGFGNGYLSAVLHKPLIEEESHDKIAAVYESLWDKTPPSDTGFERGISLRAKRHAHRKGWVGPLHWDSIDTDPEPATTERDTDRATWVLDESEHFRDAGESVHSLLTALGRKPQSVARLAHRHGRHELARWIETDIESKEAA